MGGFPFLVAQRSNVDEIVRGMSSGFRDRQSPMDPIAAARLGVWIAAGVLAVYVLVRIGGHVLRRWRSTPTWLFWRLCRAHRLSWRQLWLLWRLAAELHLSEPAEVFVDPRHLQAALAQPAFGSVRRRLRKLSERLFAEPELAILPSPRPVAAGPARDADAALEEMTLAHILAARADLEPLQRPRPNDQHAK